MASGAAYEASPVAIKQKLRRGAIFYDRRDRNAGISVKTSLNHNHNARALRALARRSAAHRATHPEATSVLQFRAMEQVAFGPVRPRRWARHAVAAAARPVPARAARSPSSRHSPRPRPDGREAGPTCRTSAPSRRTPTVDDASAPASPPRIRPASSLPSPDCASPGWPEELAHATARPERNAPALPRRISSCGPCWPGWSRSAGGLRLRDLPLELQRLGRQLRRGPCEEGVEPAAVVDAAERIGRDRKRWVWPSASLISEPRSGSAGTAAWTCCWRG